MSRTRAFALVSVLGVALGVAPGVALGVAHGGAHAVVPVVALAAAPGGSQAAAPGSARAATTATAHAEPVPLAAPAAPDAARLRGHRVPDVVLRDDAGRSFRLRELAGRPLILSPVFTRCPHACPMITRSLREALEPVGPPGERYGVLTLSFDPADTPADLAAFRRAHDLPAPWRLAVGDSAEVRRLLESLDFGFVRVPGGFAHPNGVFVLDDSLRVSDWISGLVFDTDELRRAVGRAHLSMGSTLVRRARPYLALVAALGALATLAAIRLTRRRHGA